MKKKKRYVEGTSGKKRTDMKRRNLFECMRNGHILIRFGFFFKVCMGRHKCMLHIHKHFGKSLQGMRINLEIKLCNVSEHKPCFGDMYRWREGWIDIYCCFFCRSWPFWTHFKNSGDCFTSLFVLQKVHEMSFFCPADFNCFCPYSLMQKL